jgi:hypothetical protein
MTLKLNVIDFTTFTGTVWHYITPKKFQRINSEDQNPDPRRQDWCYVSHLANAVPVPHYRVSCTVAESLTHTGTRNHFQ